LYILIEPLCSVILMYIVVHWMLCNITCTIWCINSQDATKALVSGLFLYEQLSWWFGNLLLVSIWTITLVAFVLFQSMWLVSNVPKLQCIPSWIANQSVNWFRGSCHDVKSQAQIRLRWNVSVNVTCFLIHVNVALLLCFFVRFLEVFSLPHPTLVFGNTHLSLSVISTHIWKVLKILWYFHSGFGLRLICTYHAPTRPPPPMQ